MDAFQVQNLSFIPATDDISHQIQTNGRFIYYAALSTIAFCVWLFHSPKREPHVSAPFYEVSRMKWMFNADALIKDSYCKVGVSDR